MAAIPCSGCMRAPPAVQFGSNQKKKGTGRRCTQCVAATVPSASSSVRCPCCGDPGHTRAACRHRLNPCPYCGVVGHLGMVCPGKPLRQTKQNAAAAAALSAELSLQEEGNAAAAAAEQASNRQREAERNAKAADRPLAAGSTKQEKRKTRRFRAESKRSAAAPHNLQQARCAGATASPAAGNHATAPEPEPEPELATLQPALVTLHPALAWPTGQSVRVCGLQAKPEHNGKSGVIVEWVEPKERYKVKLADGTVLGLRPQNILRDIDGGAAGSDSADTEDFDGMVDALDPTELAKLCAELKTDLSGGRSVEAMRAALKRDATFGSGVDNVQRDLLDGHSSSEDESDMMRTIHKMQRAGMSAAEIEATWAGYMPMEGLPVVPLPVPPEEAPQEEPSAAAVELEREAARLLSLSNDCVSKVSGQTQLDLARWRLALGMISSGHSPSRLLVEGGIAATMWAALPHTDGVSGGLYQAIAARLPTRQELNGQRLVERLAELLQAGLSPAANIVCGSSLSPTPLIVLAADVPGSHWFSTAFLRVLLEGGADPNTEGGADPWGFSGLTALDSASAAGNLPAVELLLGYGADPNRGTASTTLLHMAECCSLWHSHLGHRGGYPDLTGEELAQRVEQEHALLAVAKALLLAGCRPKKKDNVHQHTWAGHLRHIGFPAELLAPLDPWKPPTASGVSSAAQQQPQPPQPPQPPPHQHQGGSGNILHRNTRFRFDVGSRVECHLGAEVGGWTRGEVVAHDYSEEGWPDGQVAPYQVRLWPEGADGNGEEDGMLIFAPSDNESCIRAYEASVAAAGP